MDIQEIQGFKAIWIFRIFKHSNMTSENNLNRSPPRHMQIPGNVETHHLNGAKNLTSKLQQASEKKIYTQIYCRHCHVAHFPGNSLTVCGDRVNLTHSVTLFLPNCLKPHNKTKLLPNTGHKYRGQETAAVIGNQLSHWLEQ